MTTEEKAKRYDETLERLKGLIEGTREDKCAIVEEDIIDIFPELVESDDEKIRKDLIEWIKEFPDSIWRGHYTKDVIAWLEKQTSVKFNGEKDEKIRKVLLESFKYQQRESRTDKEWLNGIKLSKVVTWLKKQGKQKEYTFKSLPRLLDMVEPTERAKVYCLKLIDALIKEGYATDAKIVGECLKQMNGEKVALATMDEKQDAYSSTVGKYFISPEESLGMSSEEYNDVVSDCIMSEPKTAHHEGWVNIYKHDYGYTLSKDMFNTCEEAEKYSNQNTVATIKIEWRMNYD